MVTKTNFTLPETTKGTNMHHSLKHPIGLGQDPVAKTVNVKPFTGEIVKLPYMGVHKNDDVVTRPYPTEEVKMKRQSLKEIGEDAQRPPEFQDPLDILLSKIDALSRMLNCSHEHAEAVLFSRL